MKKTRFTLYMIILYGIIHQNLIAGTILSMRGAGAPVYSPSVRSMGMGGVSIALADALTINRMNPAGLVLIDRTLLSVQYGYENNRYQDPTGSANAYHSNLEGFNFALPFRRGFGIAAGLAPVTRTDYHLAYEGEIEGEVYNKAIDGTGGLNAASVSMYGSIRDFLSFGFSAQHIFGQYEEKWTVVYETASFEYSKDLFNTSNSGFRYTLGLRINPIPSLTLAGVMTTHSKITMLLESKSENMATSEQSEEEPELILPGSWGLGAVYRIGRRASIGVDYQYTDWTDLKIDENTLDDLNTTQRFSAGFEIVPSRNPLGKYFSRMAYRIGFSLQEAFVRDLDGNTINEFWISLGLGFPTLTPGARADVAFSYGKRGALDTNQLTEQMFRINLSVSASERWFLRRY